MATRSIKGKTKGLVLHNPVMQKYSNAFRAFYQICVTNALMHNVEFALSPAQVYALSKRRCYYCGSAPQLRKFGTMQYEEAFSGLDRLKPKGPYTLENVVASCKICNRIKGNASREEYIAHAHRIVAMHPDGL